jgi:molybdopterin molybdotransferase
MNTAMLLTPNDALEAVLAHVPAPKAVVRNVEDTLGAVLAEDAHYDRDYPPFHRAMMDGFGVRTADAGKSVTIVGTVPAGAHWPGRVEPGTAVEIMTGAPCPDGVEAVVPVELVALRNGVVELPEQIAQGANIAPQGSEGHQGNRLLAKGTVVTPLVAAALASIGLDRVKVFARPRVAFITTGDEVVRGDTAPAPYQIRDSNGPLLRCLLMAIGVETIASHHAADNEDSLRAALSDVGDADIVILTGGVSAGQRDLVPACCISEGFETVFHKVAQKPGKPLLFGVREGQLLFGLPGNPLAVHLCTHRYVAAAIRAMSGRSPQPETSTGLLVEEQSVRGDRTQFCFVTVSDTPDGCTLTPLRQVSSADVFTTPGADALVRLEPGTVYPAGSRIPFEWLWGGSR